MKYLRSLIVLTMVFAAGSVVDVSAQIYGKKKQKAEQVNPETAQQQSPDSTAVAGDAPTAGLERKVFKKLMKLPRYGVFDHIAFKIDGSTVTLFGKVATAINKDDAENAVKRVDGVTSVVNNIEALPPSPLDDSIRRQTLQAISRSGGLFRYFQGANPSVRIIVDRGHVALEGFVVNSGDYNTMNALASGVSNVFSVKNNLIVRGDEKVL